MFFEDIADTGAASAIVSSQISRNSWEPKYVKKYSGIRINFHLTTLNTSMGLFFYLRRLDADEVGRTSISYTLPKVTMVGAGWCPLSISAENLWVRTTAEGQPAGPNN